VEEEPVIQEESAPAPAAEEPVAVAGIPPSLSNASSSFHFMQESELDSSPVIEAEWVSVPAATEEAVNGDKDLKLVCACRVYL
jgi:hypothetical protein